MVIALRWGTALVISVALWFGALYAPVSRPHYLDLIILYSPVVAVILFGMFSIFFVVYGVLTFNDCPGEDEKLKQQINEAKRNLQKSGFEF
ncbi:unnamed protein product [Hydatigera taeniaeformis]|uniref:Dolichol-phosphate mannosyltransferase subunit 3 n=1 Tax=Hydatigena taeniaeformis TaxID=6205 RepID=A0A0R3X3G3_HYDTA|nr:unnamed protein product [Hydatigera taeniaeformis]